MKVVCGKLCGFCAGVNYTINKALEILNTNEKIYCLGKIVHNEIVIKKLEDRGMITVDSIDDIPNNSKVIFRAHGEAKETYDKAKLKNIEIIDLTCGKIKIIRKKIEKEKDKSFILIIGKKDHPEIIGNMSYSGKNSSVIENINDISSAYEQYKKTHLKNIYIISQTTFSSQKFDELVKAIKTTFIDNNVNIIIDKTICDATEKRQQEAYELSKNVDLMIIIGGKNSANTKELAKISEKNCSDYILIQNVDDLKNISFFNKNTVGVISGASTSKETVDEVVEYLKKLKY